MATESKKNIPRYQLDPLGYGVNVHFHYNKSGYQIIHTHEYYEIVLICDGVSVHNINGTEFKLCKNDMILIHPDDLHFIQPDCGDYELLNIEIKQEFFQDILALAGKRVPETIAHSGNLRLSIDNETQERWNREVYKAQLISDWTSERKSEILQQLAISMVIQFCQRIKERVHNHELINQAIKLMRRSDNIDKRLSDICAMLNYNETYIIRLFHNHGMESPNKVFRNIKLEYACGLLTTTNFKVITVAEKVGFESLSYFNHIFYKKYGVSPGEYRRLHWN